MPDSSEPNSAEARFAAELKALIPARAKIDAIEAAFWAGRRSGRRQTRIWKATTALTALLCAALWFVAPQIFETSLATRSAPAAAKADDMPAVIYSDQSIIRLQQAVLADGLAGLAGVARPNRPPMKVIHPSDLF